MAQSGRPTPRRGRLLIGTSGYGYPHWRGRLSPGRLPARAWLPFYAERFSTVELNSTFYRLPDARAFTAWRRAVPDGFVFAVKASRFLTHVGRLRAPSAPIARLLRRARRLGPALGPVLFQLPSRVHLRADRLQRPLAALDSRLTNATYGNGVLVLSMPKARGAQHGEGEKIRLEVIAATRGERVGHTGSDVRPTTTAEHRHGMRRAG